MQRWKVEELKQENLPVSIYKDKSKRTLHFTTCWMQHSLLQSASQQELKVLSPKSC